MILMRRIGRAVLVGMAALGLCLTALPSAAAGPAAAARWRIVFSRQLLATRIHNSGFLAVTTIGKRQAWALGSTDLSRTGSGVPVAYRWRGSGWHASRLPHGLRDAIGAVSAPAANDIWAVGETGFILHFNGAAWSLASKRFSGFGQLTGVTAFSPANVWVFGASGFSAGFGTWHFNGHTWTQITTAPGDRIASASALSPSNMWAIGSQNSPQDSIVHYTGTWADVTAPALAGLAFGNIAALTRTNVWATAGLQTNEFRAYLVHKAGRAWSRIKVPWSVLLIGLAADGHGGLWLTAEGPGPRAQGWVIHRSATGRWSRVLLGSHTLMFSVALIGGTRSLWGAGTVIVQAGAKATIWAYGRIP